jgi:hypothetical protein
MYWAMVLCFVTKHSYNCLIFYSFDRIQVLSIVMCVLCKCCVFVWVMRNWITNKLVALEQPNYVLVLISNPHKTLNNTNQNIY